jgi:DNA polymerase-3 subunit delta'
MFQNIIGQDHVKKLFISLIKDGRISHGYLFNGPCGIGRKSVAFELSKIIMCTGRGPEDDECGSCDSCRLLRTGTNPDLICISPPKGKDTISVEAIRDIQLELITAPLSSAKKIIIIDGAEKMTVQAQNCLLKTLEEPPSYVIIILICSNLSLILETVKSRVVRVDFTRYNDTEILQAFEKIQGDNNIDKDFIISYADGIIGRTVELKDGNALEVIRDSLTDMICKMPDISDVKSITTEIFEKNKDKIEYIFFTMLTLYRDIALFAKFGKTAEIQNKNRKRELFEISNYLKYSGAGKCIDIIDDTWKKIGRNVNYKLCIDLMLIRLQEAANG